MKRASSSVMNITILAGIAVTVSSGIAGHGVMRAFEEAHQQAYKLELQNFQLIKAILDCRNGLGMSVYLNGAHQFELNCTVEREWINGNYFRKGKKQ